MAQQSDIETHAATYHKVLGLMKYGAVACGVIAAIVIWLLASGGHR